MSDLLNIKMQEFQKIKRYIQLFLIWLFVKPKWIWGTLLLTTIPFCILYVIFSKENMIRIGVLLQWLGILAIFYNIKITKNDFNIPNTFLHFKKWLNDRPKYNPEPIYIESDSLYVNIEFFDGKLTTIAHWDDNISLEENMKVNINIINRCIDDIDNLERKITNEISETSNSFHQEISKIKSLLNSLKNDIEKVATGGINLTFMSSIWILTGVTISTIPDDIINILDWLLKIYNS